MAWADFSFKNRRESGAIAARRAKRYAFLSFGFNTFSRPLQALQSSAKLRKAPQSSKTLCGPHLCWQSIDSSWPMIHDAYRLARSIELKEKADSLLSERFEILRQLSADRIAEFPDTEPSIDLDTIDITLGDDASALLSIFICLPFLFPVPLPGLSTAFACAVIFLTIRPLLPRRPGLPSFIGKRQLKARTVEKMCHSGKSFLLRVEQLVHPRGIFLTKGIWRIISVCTVISSSVALALPFPPVIPFTNTLPALAIVFIALSELEDDGLAVIAGHFFHIATWVYFFIIGGTLFLSFEAIWEKLKTFLI